MIIHQSTDWLGNDKQMQVNLSTPMKQLHLLGIVTSHMNGTSINQQVLHGIGVFSTAEF